MASNPTPEPPSLAQLDARLKLGDVVPNFSADSTQGCIRWHEYIDRSWAVLFSQPADFSPVCTTELATVAAIHDEFQQRGVRVAVLSCNDTSAHEGWKRDIEDTIYIKNRKIVYPIISDRNRKIAATYGLVKPEESDSQGVPTSCRGVFIIGPDQRLLLSMMYPATTGHNFDEILRVIDSLQLAAQHSVATPANWKHGSQCVVQPWLTDQQAQERLGGFTLMRMPSGKRYMRLTKDPSAKRGPLKAARGGAWRLILGLGGAVAVGFLGGRMQARV